VSVVETDVVPPGGETKITATLDTKNRHGRQNKKITVHSDDPDTPKLALRIQANILTEVKAKPANLNLGRVYVNDKASSEFSLELRRPGEISISSVEAKDPRFEIERLDDGGDPEGKYRLAFSGSDKPGSVHTVILVKYEGAESGTMQIRVNASVEGILRYPRNIHFRMRGSEFAVQKIALIARTGRTVRIEKVEDSAGLLELNITQREGSRAVIEARVGKLDESFEHRIRETLVITTNVPEQPVVEIIYSISRPRR
jgi:hypothetical protein